MDSVIITSRKIDAKEIMCLVYTTVADEDGIKHIGLLQGQSHIDLIDNDTLELGYVKPVRRYNGNIFYVEKERSNSLNHVVELELRYDPGGG